MAAKPSATRVMEEVRGSGNRRGTHLAYGATSSRSSSSSCTGVMVNGADLGVADFVVFLRFLLVSVGPILPQACYGNVGIRRAGIRCDDTRHPGIGSWKNIRPHPIPSVFLDPAS